MIKEHIGNNVVLFNKFVLGGYSDLWLVIVNLITVILSISIWIYYVSPLYHIIFTITLSIMAILLFILIFLSFAIEPGIIPRNHQNYQNGKDSVDNIQIKPKPNSFVSTNNEEKIELNTIINTNDKNNVRIPSIFTSRYCNTCNIMRPPKASHCSKCDNCVIDMDHHCFYVSNCIGGRNHKIFYLMTFTGGVTCSLAAITILFHIIYVLFNSQYKIMNIMYNKYCELLVISVILILLSAFLFWRFRYHRPILSSSPFALGLLVIIALFYTIIYNDQSTQYPRWCSMVPVPFMFIIGGFAVLLSLHCYQQTRQIKRGYTTKQICSINKLVQMTIEDKNVDIPQLRKLTKEEEWRNFWTFLFKPIPKSIVYDVY